MQSGAGISLGQGRARSAAKAQGFSKVGVRPRVRLLLFRLGRVLCWTLCPLRWGWRGRGGGEGGGGGGGGGGTACKHGQKEFSMVVACPFSPLPNNGALSLLWVWTFSQVPSTVAFHSPALSVQLPLAAAHCSLDSGCLHTASPSPLPGTDVQSLGLSTQPPPELLRLWCLSQWFR